MSFTEARERYLDDMFQSKERRDYLHDMILDKLANDYWLPEWREKSNEEIGAMVQQVIGEIADYVADQEEYYIGILASDIQADRRADAEAMKHE